ncbi:MAG: GNAT family N-acetyltransferase [Anaerolinea sp.]|nr:GNAT family N-acetyltransferase [Anaerolinea sp.]
MAIDLLANGCAVRPATLDDAPDMLALYHAVSLHLVGRIEESLENVLHEMGARYTTLERDTRLIHDANGRLLALGWVNFRLPQDVGLDVHVHQDVWTTDSVIMPYLLDWAQTRALDALNCVPEHERVTLTAWRFAQDQWHRGHFESIGLQPIRSLYQMGIDFDGLVAPAPFPEDVTVRVVTRDEDWRRVYDARREAWHDMWGYIPRTYEEDYADWLEYWKHNFHDDYWFIAEKDGTVIGVCLCEPSFNGADDVGYIATVGVRRAHRKQGLGLALLRHALGALQVYGKRAAALHVDASSLTGAVALYERAGMHVKQRYDRMQKDLRAGVDQRIQPL